MDTGVPLSPPCSPRISNPGSLDIWVPSKSDGYLRYIGDLTPGRWEVLNIWVFPKIGVPQNGGFIMEHPIKMDDLGVPLFSETSI